MRTHKEGLLHSGSWIYFLAVPLPSNCSGTCTATAAVAVEVQGEGGRGKEALEISPYIM